MKVCEILLHRLPCLFRFLPHAETVADTPDGVVKERVIPLPAFDRTIREDEKRALAVGWLPTLDVVSWAGHSSAPSSPSPLRSRNRDGMFVGRILSDEESKKQVS